MTPADYAKASRTLARRDPVIAALVRKYGECGLGRRQHTDPFAALVQAIISQQLSTRAASTIAGRFRDLFGEAFPSAADVDCVPDDRLRAVGLSAQKISYLRDLCRCIQEGSLPLQQLHELDDEAVIEALVAVKGIGRWTAEMFLMFRLQRPDVLPVGDLGIVKAVQKQYRLRKTPTADRLQRIGETWRPYRSVACWYLWASLNNAPMKED
jgi:DNA-3-methyladenine glycosylase II